jgi:hypothetical protein
MKAQHDDPFLYLSIAGMLGRGWSTGHGFDPFMPSDGRNPAVVVIKLHTITSTEVCSRWCRIVKRHLDWAGWWPLGVGGGRSTIPRSDSECLRCQLARTRN